VVGVEIVEGVTDVPAEESDSPSAETPGAAALGPTVIVVVGAVAVAAVFGDAASPVEAGAVPVGVAGADNEVAGAVPVGVRMSEVAVVGAPRMAEVGEVAVVPAEVELPAVPVEPGVGVEVPM
jgi:hypothetical protein